MSRGPQGLVRIRLVTLLLFLVLVLTGFANTGAVRFGEHYTCRGVQRTRPWGCIGMTSEFLTSDTMVFAWAKLYDITKSYKIEFHWSIINELGQRIGRYVHRWNSTDPKSMGDTHWDWDIHWDYIPIDTRDAIGRWSVSMSVDDQEAFELEFTVKRDTNLAQTTETIFVSSTLSSTLTSTAVTTITETSAKEQYLLITILPFPLEISTVAGLIAVCSYSAYRLGGSRKPTMGQRDEPLAGYLTRLEELRSRNEISQITYERLKEEYWTRMKGSTNRG